MPNLPIFKQSISQFYILLLNDRPAQLSKPLQSLLPFVVLLQKIEACRLSSSIFGSTLSGFS